MAEIYGFLLNYVTISILTLLCSNDLKNIRLRIIFRLMLIEAAPAYFSVQPASGLALVSAISGFLETIQIFI